MTIIVDKLANHFRLRFRFTECFATFVKGCNFKTVICNAQRAHKTQKYEYEHIPNIITIVIFTIVLPDSLVESTKNYFKNLSIWRKEKLSLTQRNFLTTSNDELVLSLTINTMCFSASSILA